MSEERVRIEVADHVATVTLARGDKHNALDRAMFEGIVAAAQEVSETPGVRAVVLQLVQRERDDLQAQAPSRSRAPRASQLEPGAHGGAPAGAPP